jgi:Tfp pilus assembly protein PilO
MIHRKKELTFFVILVGCLLLSLGYNWHLSWCIQRLENAIQRNSWVTPLEYQKIVEEIKRLENVKYK